MVGVPLQLVSRWSAVVHWVPLARLLGAVARRTHGRARGGRAGHRVPLGRPREGRGRRLERRLVDDRADPGAVGRHVPRVFGLGRHRRGVRRRPEGGLRLRALVRVASVAPLLVRLARPLSVAELAPLRVGVCRGVVQLPVVLRHDLSPGQQAQNVDDDGAQQRVQSHGEPWPHEVHEEIGGGSVSHADQRQHSRDGEDEQGCVAPCLREDGLPLLARRDNLGAVNARRFGHDTPLQKLRTVRTLGKRSKPAHSVDRIQATMNYIAAFIPSTK